MRILIATYYLRDWTGSELFVKDLARCLASRGHKVHLHSPILGDLASHLAADGLHVTSRLAELAAVPIDVAHVQHNVVAAAVRAAMPALPMVMMLHGVLPELERPPSVDLGIHKFLCASEEVEEHARRLGTFGSQTEVVRNFVDTDHWQATQPVRPRLKRVLVLANDYPMEMRATVQAACTSVGAELEHVGLPENQQRDVRPHIRQADLVITLGRGAIEAMAMGRNVVVMGAQCGDGLVDERSFFEFRRRNFSGRTRGITFTPETLANELLRYNPSLGTRLREIVCAENSADRVVRQLEQIYGAASSQRVEFAEDTPLLKETSMLYREVCNSGEYLPLKDYCTVLKEQLRMSEAQLADMHSSASWRVTTPLRMVGRFLRRAHWAAKKAGRIRS